MADEIAGSAGESLATPVNDGIITMGDLRVDAEDLSQLNFAERKERIARKYEAAAEAVSDEEDAVVFGAEDAPRAKAEATEGSTSPVEPVEQDIPTDTPPKPAEAVTEPPVAEEVPEGEAPASGKFKVRDAQGNFVTPPDVKVDFTVGDKSYRKNIPDLVRMALDGVSGQRAVSQVKQYEAEVIPQLRSQYEARINEQTADFEAQSSLVRRILSDPTGEEWAKQVEEWQKLHSPEAQVQRAQERTAALEKQVQSTQRAEVIRQVNETHIKPLVDLIGRECPDVDQDMLTGLMFKYTAQLQGPLLTEARQKQQRFNDVRGAQVAKLEAERKAEAEKHAKALKDAQRKQNATVASIAPSKVQQSSDQAGEAPLTSIKTMKDWKSHVNKDYRQYA